MSRYFAGAIPYNTTRMEITHVTHSKIFYTHTDEAPALATA